MKIISKIILALTLMLGTTSYTKGQANLQLRDLFAAAQIEKDSSDMDFTRIQVSFLVDRPELAARVEIKIGLQEGTDEVYSGNATFEIINNIVHAVFQGHYYPLWGDNTTIYFSGDKSKYNNAKYVTIQVQATDGSLSKVYSTFVRFF